MLGYCATGKVTTAMAPAIIRTMAITQAKTGRSMKNLDTNGSWLWRQRSEADAGEIRGGDLPAVELVWRHFHGLNLGNAGPEPLQSDDNHPVAGRDAVAHQPLVADGPLGLDHARADGVIGAHYHRGRVAKRVVRDCALRDQQTLFVDAFLQLLMYEHAGQQNVLRIGKYRSQRHGTGAGVHRDFGEL